MPFNPQPVKDFIGSGITFPFNLVNGSIQVDSGFSLIRASIKTILSFQFGTRFMLGEFGSRLDDLIEEPNDEVLANVINTFVGDAVTRWEKRVSMVSSQILRPDDRTINLLITYQIKNSQTPDNFVYPFYSQLIY